MAPFADAVFGMDSKFWKRYGEEADGEYELWTCGSEAARLFNLNYIAAEPGAGVSDKPGTLRHGGNSGYLAVGLALHFGASRITLLGYDMQDTGGRLHFHRDHPDDIGNPIVSRFKAWRRAFAELERATDVEIVNASRATALECFPRMQLRAALER